VATLLRILLAPSCAVAAITLAGCASFAGRAAAPDEAGEPTSPAPPQAAAPLTGPTAVVHVETTYDASLVRLGENNEVVDRCPSPCDRALPLQGTYRIDGPQIRSTWPFHLEGAAGQRLVLHVSPSLRSTYATGKTLGNVGGVAAGLGFGVALFGALTATSDADANGGSGKACPGCTAAVVGGGIVMLVGVGLATAGIVMGISNLSSDAVQVRF
jgi:hypothetical protein